MAQLRLERSVRGVIMRVQPFTAVTVAGLLLGCATQPPPPAPAPIVIVQPAAAPPAPIAAPPPPAAKPQPKAVIAAPSTQPPTKPAPPIVPPPPTKTVTAPRPAPGPLDTLPAKHRRILVAGGLGCKLAGTMRGLIAATNKGGTLYEQKAHDALRRRSCRTLGGPERMAVMVEPGPDQLMLVIDAKGDQLWTHTRLLTTK